MILDNSLIFNFLIHFINITRFERCTNSGMVLYSGMVAAIYYC